MIYKGFCIDYSEKDDVHIISIAHGYVKDIVGNSGTLKEAQKLIDFYAEVVYVKERF